MRIPPPERQQTAEAAGVGAGEATAGIRQELSQQIQAEIVAPDVHQGPLDDGRVTVKLHGHILTGLHPFREAWDAHDAVGANERGDDAGSAGERRGNGPLADPSHGHPHHLVLAQGREELAGD